MNLPEIETERLILRSFTEADLEALYRLLKDETVNTFLPWFPVKNLEETKDFFEERLVTSDRESAGYHYAICLKQDRVPVGYVNVEMDDSHDFGYGLLADFWHRGIVTEAGMAVIAQLQADGVPYITATHDVHNPRSGAVMQRLGMQYQYSYKERWMPKDIPVIFRMYQRNLDGRTERVYRAYWEQSEEHFVELL